MEQNPPKLMTPFDCATTPQWLYTLKLLLPYTPPKLQRSFALLIRIQEMKYTMEHFNSFSSKITSNLLSGLKPYMQPAEQEMMEQMESMMNMMELMQDMMPSDGMADAEIFDLYNNLFGNMKGASEHE